VSSYQQITELIDNSSDIIADPTGV